MSKEKNSLNFSNADDDKKINDVTLTKEQQIKARIQVVCICKGIRQARICDAILNGCKTKAEVFAKTGSGNGGCQARRCGPVIEKLIENKGIPLAKPQIEESLEGEEDF